MPAISPHIEQPPGRSWGGTRRRSCCQNREAANSAVPAVYRAQDQPGQGATQTLLENPSLRTGQVRRLDVIGNTEGPSCRPRNQHLHHMLNINTIESIVLVHPCIQPTDGNTLRCWKPAGLLHAAAQAPCAETCRTLRSSSPAPRPLLQAPLTVLRKADSSVSALPPRLLPTSYLADPTDSRDDS